MAITLSNEQRNLNDGSTYYIISFDVGAPATDEVWIEPMVSGASPVQAVSVARKTKATITVGIKTTTLALMRTAVSNVVADFGVSNTLTWGLTGLSTVAWKTFPTNIEVPPMSNRDALFVANNQFIIPEWSFSVWRAPLTTSGTYVAI